MTSQLVVAHAGHWLASVLPLGMLGFFVYLLKGGGGKPGSRRP